MQILVLYSSVEGQTGKIAGTLAKEFETLGNEVFLTKATDPGYCDPGTYDAAVLCGPIHIGHYPSDFVSYIQNWKHALITIPNALLTISLAIASEDEDDRSEARNYPEKLIKKTGWKPDELVHVAGALKFVEYDFFKRWVMKWIAQKQGGPVDTNKDYEFTDWDALRKFAEAFVSKHK